MRRHAIGGNREAGLAPSVRFVLSGARDPAFVSSVSFPQGLNQVEQRPQRLDAEYSLGTAGVSANAVGIGPRSRQPHGDAIGGAHHELLSAALQHLDRLALQRVVSSGDLHFQRVGVRQ